MSKKFYIIPLLVVLVLAGYIVFINSQSNPGGQDKQLVEVAEAQGCCMNPPCEECFAEKGYCNCQQREEKGLGTCGECEEAEGCEEQAEVCTVDLEDNY